MEYLDIIEENLTKDEFVAYLRGSILMFLLSEQPLVLSEFKLYANKLVEVVKDPRVGSAIEEVPQEQQVQQQPTVDPDEPKVQPKHEFKLGDHVIISKGSIDERTGVIVRLPMEGVDCRSSYVVDLDDKDLGWRATVDVDGVDCQNAWVTGARNLQLLEEQPELPPKQPENALEPNKWYHTQDFTVEKLKELLPSGTHLQVEKEAWYNGIETEPPTSTQTGVVIGISTSCLGDEPLIETNGSIYLKEWFKITEEN